MIKRKQIFGAIIGAIGFIAMCSYGDWKTATGDLLLIIGVVKCLK